MAEGDENKDPESVPLIEVKEDDVLAKRLQNPNLKDVKREQLEKGDQYYYENDDRDSAARDENFFESICLCLCPTISWRQFIVWVSLFEILLFIISCSIYGVTNEALLAPDPHALEILGWSDSRKIKNGWQLHRWFMPIFLHGHLEHLIGNLSG